MDVKNPGWFGQMQVSGTSRVFDEFGSIIGMMGRFNRELTQLNPRELIDGKSITIRFRDKPIDAKVKSLTEQAMDMESQLQINEDETGGPAEGETYVEFFDRLIGKGFHPNVARYFADDWFDKPKDEQTVRWMNDPKCARFSELQGSKVAYEQALPTEYEMLKQYVIQEYPERAKLITFKIA